VVETDASDIGIGAVLMQKDRPIAFLSKALGDSHKTKSIYEKEFLALIMAVEKWRQYLQRQEFIIRTDYQSLAYLTEQNLHSELQRKAMTRLMGLQFRVVYRKGWENPAADALSRVGHMMAIQAMSSVQPQWIQEVTNSYVTDKEAQDLLARLILVSPDIHGFSLDNGVIRQHGKIWVGHNSAVQTRIIAAMHASPVGGHSGQKATFPRVSNMFAWKGLKRDVVNFVQQCGVCQQAKHTHTHPAGLLQPLPIPEGVWRDISLDFVEGLPKVDGYSVILVVVDRFTKYAHFMALKHPYTALSVAKVLYDQVIKLHGMPQSMISDRDKVFTSTVWTELFKMEGVQLKYSTAYHPQTDDQTERVNQCLEMYLRCAVSQSPRQWKAWLSQAEFWYNTTFHSSLGCSPFRALYGYDPTVGAMLDATVKPPASIAEFVIDRQLQCGLLRDQLARAQLRMKQNADRKRTDVEFQVGDQVLLKLQPYVQTSVASRPFPKLALKYYGPFAVLERVGAAAYKLALPPDSLIHPTFHVSQLKPFRPDFTPVYSSLPSSVDLHSVELEPEQVLARWLVKKGNAVIPQVLIKWSKLPEASSTWEDYNVVKERFPVALAWGPASSSAGGDVMPQVPTSA